MEVEEIQTPACKFPRIANGRLDSTTKLAQKDQYPDDEDDHRDPHHQQQQHLKRPASAVASSTPTPPQVGAAGLASDNTTSANRLRGWHHSSRIIRVSRASGGKDRHSKVWTSKGLRDRRVRLSVNTAIQFYDLQDRLGYDQPSKAVEWLINAAADSIADLPSLNSPFPDTPKQLSDEKRASEEQGFDSVELDGNEAAYHQQNQSQHRSLTKSACSSTSETSKGSGLSLSRSEQRNNRVKARERARVRAKEKEKDIDSSSHHHHHHHHQQNVSHISQSSSFTELLTGGIRSTVNNNNSSSNNNTTSPNGGSPPNGEPNLFQKAGRSWSAATPMDYFNTELLGPSSSSRRHHHHHFTGHQIQLGSSNSLPQTMSIPSFSASNENHHQQEMQHFSFVPEHMIPVTSTQQGGLGGDNNNLNFTISSGFNRGTLQSNSSSTPSLLPHLQRFTSSPIDGSNLPFYIGAPPPPPHVDSTHHHHHHQHQFPAGFDARLHLYYGDGSRHSDHKGKPKN